MGEIKCPNDMFMIAVLQQHNIEQKAADLIEVFKALKKIRRA